MQISKLIENTVIIRNPADTDKYDYWISAKFLVDGDYSTIQYTDGTPWTQWNGVPLSNNVIPFAPDSAGNSMCVVFSIFNQYD